MEQENSFKSLWNSLGKYIKVLIVAWLIVSYSFYLLDFTEVLFTKGIVNLYYVLFGLMQILRAILALVIGYKLLKFVKSRKI